MKRVEEKLRSLLAEVAPNSREIVVTEQTNLIDDLGFDSIMMMEFVVEIEENFDVVIDGDDLKVEIISNFGSLINLVFERSNYE